MNYSKEGRLTRIRNYVGLVLYLAGGWRSYREISEEFGFCTKTGHRNVYSLEQAGLPVEWLYEPDKTGSKPSEQKMRLPPDWVARTPWLRRYIILNELPKPSETTLVKSRIRPIGVTE